MSEIYFYLLVMAAVTYGVRMIPLVFFRKPLQNQFLQSFLYYVPYVTLAVMTFPAIMEASQAPLAGLLALLAGSGAAWQGANLFQVAIICCSVVFIVELLLLA